MNKTEIEYIKGRVNNVVKCTCGTISSKLNAQKQDEQLTTEEKVRLIRDGKATLVSDIQLKEQAGYHPINPL